MAFRRWADLTTREAAALGADALAILPCGAVEQHGPHLPLSVDGDIAAAVLAAAEAAAPTLDAVVLPALSVGVSVEHADFPGTLTLSAPTFIRAVVEIGEGVAAAGVRRLVLLNGHGGQPQALDMAAQELRRTKAMMVAVVNTFDLYDASFFGAEEATFGIHAGAVETSIMLAIDPARVRREEIRNFDSLTRRLKADHAHASPQGKFGFAWQAQDLNPEGAVGDARAADPAKGAALLAQSGAKLAAILEDYRRLPLDVLASR